MSMRARYLPECRIFAILPAFFAYLTAQMLSSAFTKTPHSLIKDVIA